jgi:hypothetical protein
MDSPGDGNSQFLWVGLPQADTIATVSFPGFAGNAVIGRGGLMRRWKAVLIIALVTGLGATAVWLHGTRQGRQPREDRIPALTRLVAAQEEESAQAVMDYRPAIRARIDDLGLPVADLLRQLPGVADAEVCVPAENPTHRIVHLRDWHFVPKDLYAVEAEGMTAGEFDRLHRELLLEVEAVQLEQLALLRCLIRHHGLTRIFCEGLTADGLPVYREKIAVLRQMEETQIGELRRQLADIRQMLQRTKPDTERYGKAQAIEAEIAAMLEDHKHRLLEIGRRPAPDRRRDRRRAAAGRPGIARPRQTRHAEREVSARSGAAGRPPGCAGEAGAGEGGLRPDRAGRGARFKRRRAPAGAGAMRIHPAGDAAVQGIQRVGALRAGPAST